MVVEKEIEGGKGREEKEEKEVNVGGNRGGGLQTFIDSKLLGWW